MEVFRPIKKFGRSEEFSYKEITAGSKRSFELLNLVDESGTRWLVKKKFESDAYQETDRSKSYMEFGLYEIVRAPKSLSGKFESSANQPSYVAIQAFVLEETEWRFSIIKLDPYEYLAKADYKKAVLKMRAFLELPPYLRNKHIIRE